MRVTSAAVLRKVLAFNAVAIHRWLSFSSIGRLW